MIRETPRVITKDELPEFYAALKALGKNNDERGEKLSANARWVERLMDRLPESLTPLVRGEQGSVILRALLEDLERRAA